jgi:16S rRNA G966 N2-methylase RsmD
MDIYFPIYKDINLSELKISEVGKYSISKPKDAFIINNIIASYFPKGTKLTITDCCANNGGNTINFALKFYKVNSVEISKEEFDILSHNVKVYKLKNVKLIHDDYLKQMLLLKQDVLFIDAPWGGPFYFKKKELDLFLGNKNIIDIVKELHDKKLFKLCVLKVPKNYNFINLFRLNNLKFEIYTLHKFIIICLKI